MSWRQIELEKDDLEKTVRNLSLRSIYKTSSYVLSEIYILYFVAQHFTNYKSTIKLGLMFIFNKRLVLVPSKRKKKIERERERLVIVHPNLWVHL